MRSIDQAGVVLAARVHRRLGQLRLWWVPVILVPLHVLGYRNWWLGDIRTTSAAVDYAFASLVFFSPAVSMLSVYGLLPLWPRFLLYALAIPWSIWCSFLGLYASATAIAILSAGSDPGYAYLHSLARERDRIAVYRWNGGATTDWQIVIRQEEYLLPGIVRVREVHSYDHCYDASVVSIGESSILVRCDAETRDLNDLREEVVRLVQGGDA